MNEWLDKRVHENACDKRARCLDKSFPPEEGRSVRVVAPSLCRGLDPFRSQVTLRVIASSPRQWEDSSRSERIEEEEEEEEEEVG